MSNCDLATHWVARDLQHIWHPCSQMQDYESFPPLVVKKAKGCFIELMDGKKLIDANASWWCKSLGHGHPRLKKALIKQAERYEHVISANMAQKPLIQLSEKLAQLTPSQKLNKIFYAADGSSAVEIALKMSLHARQHQNTPERCHFMALENAYHGETLFCMVISDLGLYCEPYAAVLPKAHLLKNVPYVHSKEDPIFSNCEWHWPTLKRQLDQAASTLSAIIVEPIIQGTAGMLMLSKDFLARLSRWCKINQVHLIIDEIMTGLGRTGYALASNQTPTDPDFICLGKGLTGGFLPMSAVLTTPDIYTLFYDDYEKGKSFLHSNTFSGNALAAAVALECLTILEEEDIYAEVQYKEQFFRQYMMEVAEETNNLTHIRGMGAVIAADLVEDENQKPSAKSVSKRRGFAVFQEATKRGALLRPLGNTLYWLPPLNISLKTLKQLRDMTIASIMAVKLSSE